ncbi:MAG TPA: hypothetical protein EYN38_08050 [Flavobacteriales bacterium]|nr:hypothetical protein [Flavobacteriales bacterium]
MPKRKPKKLLDDKEHLFTMLSALVKKFGGEVTISRQDLEDLHPDEALSLIYDPVKKQIILKFIEMGLKKDNVMN